MANIGSRDSFRGPPPGRWAGNPIFGSSPEDRPREKLRNRYPDQPDFSAVFPAGFSGSEEGGGG